MRITAIDPGISTGWVVANYEGGVPEIVEYGQERFDGPIEATRFIISRLLPDTTDVLILEQFDLRPQNKFTAELSPVEINAILKYWVEYLGDSRIQLVFTTPAQHKGLVTNEVLKNIGWYVMPKQVGQKDADDARDAFRLLTHYIVTVEKDKEFTLCGWPR